VFNFRDRYGHIKYGDNTKRNKSVVSLRDLFRRDECREVGPRLVDDDKQLIEHIGVAFSASKNKKKTLPEQGENADV